MAIDDQLRARYGGIMDRPHDYLVISGGGGDGAYGAGLLVGWTAAGTRPEFQIVTGISTGALIAPFPFLGADYDPVLREIYTELSTKDLLEPYGPLQILQGDAVSSTAPLRQKIADYLDEEVLAKIAAEGRKGRSLLVGTTNLDAGRPVIWDITRMAASDAPNIIRNAKLRADWHTVKRRLKPIMIRTIDTLIRTQGIGDLAQLYIVARGQGLDYHLTSIPASFHAVSNEPFDTEYMNKLFQVGERRARAGDPWLTPGGSD